MAAVQQQDNWYLSLLGFSESFRTSNPPNFRLCIHCLKTILNLKPPPRIETRTHLQLGNVLYTHTKNLDLARAHLEKAWAMSQNLTSFEDVRFEAASILAMVYEKMKQTANAKPLLRKAVDISHQSPYWRCRLLFQLAQLHINDREFSAACGLLAAGADFCASTRNEHTRILFLLSKGMILLVNKDLQEVHQVLSLCGQLIDQFVSQANQKESLKVFFLVLQVAHFLMAGQVKSVKPSLKQLHQSIQTITSIHDDDLLGGTQPDMFQWMSKEHLCVLVYLVTVMHSMQAGYMEKAQKYTEKALQQIDKLKMLDEHPLLSTFQILLLEHIVMVRLITGNKTTAIRETLQACHTCQEQPRLLQSHGSQLHTLLGLYAMSMNCMEAAEAQFTTALKMSADNQLWIFAKLNLAIVFLRSNRLAEFVRLMESVDPDTQSATYHSHSLRASAYFVKGLQAFFQARYNEAKRYLRETLKMANTEDLNRLTSMALVVLGHIFLSLGNSQEAMNMVTPAMQLASKIPDVHVQLWSSALLRDLYRLQGDQLKEVEGQQLHASFTQSLLEDHIQSSQTTEHTLIQWTEGPCPLLSGANNPGPSGLL